MLVLALALLGLCSALTCPDGNLCGDGDTCCPTSSGGYGCCPQPIAQEDVKAVVCPDQESECPDGTTCCQLPGGDWGCCPLANAVCCEDRRHCCPENTKCDIQHSKCVSATYGSTPMWTKFPARRRKLAPVTSVESVTCPDEQTACPSETTCCKMKTGGYGCCPYPSAVCCSDQLHCCPNNTTCDLKHRKCVSSHTQTHLPLALKLPALPIHGQSSKDVICPDRVSMCPEETTCCALGNGSYGCCPMPKAVCCTDHLHCCPEATSCDLAHSTCVSANGPVAWVTKIPARTRIFSKAAVVPCSDTAACPDGSTCCKTASGDWACCPLEEAVCCPDHIHCCPHDTVCNLRASTCDDPTNPLSSVPLLKKFSSLPLKKGLAPPTPPPTANHECDESYSCPDSYTCCQTAGGGWGCCPLPEAVCCEDKLHCCPHGTTCNLAASTCDGANGSPVPLLRKVPALRTNASPLLSTGSAVLDATHKALSPSHQRMCDKNTACPEDTTCCFMKIAGKWGCCPFKEAVCCKTNDHCCPGGLTCNEERKSCIQAYFEIPWQRKQKANVIKETQGSETNVDLEDIKCDNESSCASGSTCCKLPTGDWGCCPLIKAVCCADHQHCCPQGYTCDLESGTCVKPMTQAKPVALSLLTGAKQLREDVQCDAESRCGSDQTCCRTSTNSWACCPYKTAVCCPDMKSCCPVGYTCNPEAGGCSKSSGLTWWRDLAERSRD